MELEAELHKYGKRLLQSHHMFLPRAEIHNMEPCFDVKWFEQEDIKNLYGRREFSNADTKLFWQIGIDVLPEYRSTGVGTGLVQLLKNETFRRGAIPFYGTSLSNLHSWNIALNCGFYPVWVEIETEEED